MQCLSLKQRFEWLKPYEDVIIFMITLLVANYAWKWTFVGDENGDVVTWLGYDVTAPFEFMACHIAQVVYWLVSLFRDTVYMVGDHTVRFETGSVVRSYGAVRDSSRVLYGCVLS